MTLAVEQDVKPPTLTLSYLTFLLQDQCFSWIEICIAKPLLSRLHISKYLILWTQFFSSQSFYFLLVWT